MTKWNFGDGPFVPELTGQARSFSTDEDVRAKFEIVPSEDATIIVVVDPRASKVEVARTGSE